MKSPTVEKDPIVLSPEYFTWDAGSDTSITGTLSPEEIVAEAEVEARARRWTFPLKGTIVMNEDDGEIRQIEVDPLSAVAIRKARVEWERVEWIIVRECR